MLLDFLRFKNRYPAAKAMVIMATIPATVIVGKGAMLK
jgi:hypothetical protein